MNDTETQQRLVLWAYVIQWSSLLVLPAMLGSLVYLLAIRQRVTVGGLRSHVDWQLMTCWTLVAAIPIGLALLYVGASGISTDAPISIVATFVLLGLACLFPLWFMYRLFWGSVKFYTQSPMTTLFP